MAPPRLRATRRLSAAAADVAHRAVAQRMARRRCRCRGRIGGAQRHRHRATAAPAPGQASGVWVDENSVFVAGHHVEHRGAPIRPAGSTSMPSSHDRSVSNAYATSDDEALPTQLHLSDDGDAEAPRSGRRRRRGRGGIAAAADGRRRRRRRGVGRPSALGAAARRHGGGAAVSPARRDGRRAGVGDVAATRSWRSSWCSGRRRTRRRRSSTPTRRWRRGCRPSTTSTWRARSSRCGRRRNAAGAAGRGGAARPRRVPGDAQEVHARRRPDDRAARRGPAGGGRLDARLGARHRARLRQVPHRRLRAHRPVHELGDARGLRRRAHLPARDVHQAAARRRLGVAQGPRRDPRALRGARSSATASSAAR